MHTNPLIAMIEESIRLKDSAQEILSEAIEGTSLTRMERLVLIFVCGSEELMTAPQIGRHSGHTRQVIQRAATQLEQLGLIEKVANPDHKTAALLKATEAGLAYESNVRTTLESLINGIVSDKDLQACERMTKEMRKLRAKIENYESDRSGENDDVNVFSLYRRKS